MIGWWFHAGTMPSAARGEPVEFTLDPSLGRFTFSGTFGGLPLVPQSPGTDTTGYSAPGWWTWTTPRDAVVLRHPAAGGGPPVPVRGRERRRPRPGPGELRLVADGPEDDPSTSRSPHEPEHQRRGRAVQQPAAPLDSSLLLFHQRGTMHVGTTEIPSAADMHGKAGAGVERRGPITLTEAAGVQTLTVPLRTTFTHVDFAEDDMRSRSTGRPRRDPRRAGAGGGAGPVAFAGMSFLRRTRPRRRRPCKPPA